MSSSIHDDESRIPFVREETQRGGRGSHAISYNVLCLEKLESVFCLTEFNNDLE